jgi:hypothetical protein
MKTLPMTELFIQSHWETGGGSSCPRCKAPAQRSMCEKHLHKYKIAFRQWTIERVSKGLCVHCHAKSHIVTGGARGKRQGVYCRTHREKNRVKSLKWSRKNRPSIRASYWGRRIQGVCQSSSKHGKTFGDHIYCKACHLARKVAKSLKKLTQRSKS